MAETSWIVNTATNKSDTKAGQATNDLLEIRAQERRMNDTGDLVDTKWNKQNVDSFWSFTEVDVVGINASKISNVIDAINQYVTKINNHLDGINEDANQSGAFAGEDVQEAVRTYIAQVKTYCKNLTTQLRAFSDKLVEINNVWTRNRATLASNINQSANFNAGSEYRSSAGTGAVPVSPGTPGRIS